MLAARPDLSYIVSLYNRPDYLAVCCYMLKMQTHRNFEVIVTDNTTDNAIARRHRELVHQLKDKRFSYVRTAGKIEVSDCYWSAEYGMTLATGQWLCFPCEDCYYPPEWGQRMLTAGVRYGLDLVLCEKLIAGPEPSGMDRYFEVTMGSMGFPGYKPSFIVKREHFPEWLNKPTMGACSGVDRTTLQAMVRNPELKWGVARDLFYFHN